MTIEYGLIAIAVLCLAWLGFMEYRLQRFFKGKNGGSLETIIRGIVDEIEAMHNDEDQRITYLQGLESRLRRSIQGVSTVRFNPFEMWAANKVLLQHF